MAAASTVSTSLGIGVIFKVNEDGSNYAVVHSFAGNEFGFINGGDSFLTPVGGSVYGVTPNGDAFRPRGHLPCGRSAATRSPSPVAAMTL